MSAYGLQATAPLLDSTRKPGLFRRWLDPGFRYTQAGLRLLRRQPSLLPRRGSRPGYEGKQSAERRGACEAPGCCEHPGARAKRATSLCDQEGCASRRSTAVTFGLSGRACVLPAQTVPEVVQRAPRVRVVSMPVGRSPKAPGRPADETGPAGTASCSICRSSPEDAPQRAGRVAYTRPCVEAV